MAIHAALMVNEKSVGRSERSKDLFSPSSKTLCGLPVKGNKTSKFLIGANSVTCKNCLKVFDSAHDRSEKIMNS